jgi:hypothetical protein
MYQDTGIESNQFTYSKMIDYVNGIGDYWIRLVEQFIPATTIWNTGTRFENSIFHRQKFIYRPQRGCLTVTIPIEGPSGGGDIDNTDCNGSRVETLTPLRANEIQEQLDIVAKELCTPKGSNQVILANLDRIRYCFSLTITRSNPSQGQSPVYTTETFCSPTQYSPPNLIPSTSQWQSFVSQGINYLSGELAQQGLIGSYSPDADTIYVESAICDDVESVEFDLIFKIDNYSCPQKGGLNKGGLNEGGVIK